MVLDQKRLSWTTLSPNSTLRTVILTCLVGALSYLVARLGGALVLRPQMVWPLWPGCAFLVAVLLLAPRRIWAFLMLAGLSGFVVYDLQAGLTLRSIALLILADTVEILVAALGVSYAFDGRPCLNSVKSLAKYLFFAVLLGSLASAFLASVAFGTNYGIRWRIGFFTEALALLTLTPAILSWANVRQRWTRKSRAFYFEAATLAGGLSLLGYVAFLAPGHFGSPALLYSLLPFLLWSSLRFGVSGICTSMVLVALLSIWGAVHGRGPFIGSEPLNNVMSLQLFLFFGATTFMVLAVVVEEQKQSERAFRESEKRFRLVADTAPALIWMADTDKLCAYFNKPWLDFTGRSMEAELGNGWAEGVHPADLQKCMDTYWQAFDRREEFRLEYRLRRHDGEYRWVLDIGVPRFDQHSSFIGYIGCGVDVTERKHAEEALRESEAYLSEAQRLTHTGSGAWQVPGGDALYLSDEWYRIYGFDSKAGLSVWNDRLQRMHPEDRAKVEETKDRAIRGKSDYEVDHRILLPDGTVKYTHTVGHPVLNARGDAEQFVFTMMDVTERKRSEEALSTMSRRLIAAQEQERARIARELHDDIGQRLALLAVELDQLHHDPQNLPEVGSRLGELQKQASEIATGIQTLSHELHSSKLEYLGIASAMRGFCQEFGRQQKVEIDFKTHDLPSPLSPDISLCLFRVVQEGLHNSVKHSGARHVEVRLWGTLNEIHLTVTDPGVGFDSEAVKESRGLGLVSMEERLKLLRGTLLIESQRNFGTAIHARVPFNSGSDSVRAAG